MITTQDVLLVFDAANEPFLTTAGVAEGLPVSRDAVYRRLETMRERGLVGKKKAGARAVGWWAEVAPRLSSEAAERADAANREDAIPLEELDGERSQ